MSKTKYLFILDLDHALVYASFAEPESAALLFQYNEYMKVYERPFVRELIAQCKAMGDVMVYTTAKLECASRTCSELNINPTELVARENNHLCNLIFP